MKKNLQEYRKMSINEITATIWESRGKLANLRLDLTEQKLKNVKEISKAKKDIAQLLTIKKELEKSKDSRDNK